MTTTQGEHAQTALAHELFAAAQLAPGEGIEDAVSRIAAALTAAPAQPAAHQGGAYAELPASYQSSTLIAGNDGCTVTFHFGTGCEADVESWLSAVTERASHGQAPAGAVAARRAKYLRNDTDAGRAYIAQYLRSMGQHYFDAYIQTDLAGDFACALAAVLSLSTAQAAPAAGAVAGEEIGWINAGELLALKQGAAYAHVYASKGTGVSQPVYAAAPTPPAQAADSVLKDHQIAALVNELRDIAVEFKGTQQLRERIAQVVVPALKAQKAERVLEDAGKENICIDCTNADSWGLPDKSCCQSCVASSNWQPLNRSSVHPNAARKQGGKHD